MDDWEDLEPDPFDQVLEDNTIAAPVCNSRATPAEPDPPESSAVTPPAPPGDVDVDEPVCRICFAGTDEDDLGRLISPCLCRGTVAKVHLTCLNRWRLSSRGSSSFFQCDQCRYRYRVKRAKIAGLAENRYALASLAGTFFLVLVFLNGFIGNWLLQKANSDSLVGDVFFSGPADQYYQSSWHWDSALPLEAVGQAVELASKVAEELSHQKESDHRLEETAWSDTSDSESESSYRMVRKRKSRSRRSAAANYISQMVSHFVLGISMTGIGSFLWLLMTLPLLPLHPMRNGLFRSLRSTRDSRGNASPLGSALLVLFVVVGLVKSLQLCWKLTRKTAHLILRRAEEGILEVRN